MNNRDELEAALQANAAMEVPAPDPAFLDALEQRLRSAGSARVVPLTRRARRLGATTLVVTLVLTGAAAAAGLVLTDPFGDDDDTPGAAATTSAAATTAVASTAPTSTVEEPATTLEAVTTTTQHVAPAPTTTEVHVPATFTVECHATGSSTQCSWGPLPAGTTKLLVLRGQYAPSGPGRVFVADIGAGVWTDPMPTPGVTYSFVLRAYDASDTDLGHSPLVMVDCC